MQLTDEAVERIVEVDGGRDRRCTGSVRHSDTGDPADGIVRLLLDHLDTAEAFSAAANETLEVIELLDHATVARAVRTLAINNHFYPGLDGTRSGRSGGVCGAICVQGRAVGTPHFR